MGSEMCIRDSPTSGHAFFVFVPVDSIRDVECSGDKVKRFNQNFTLDLKGKFVTCLDMHLKNVIINDTIKQTKAESANNVWNSQCDRLDNIESVCDKELCHAIVDFKNSVLSLCFPDSSGEARELNICLLYTSPSPRDLSTSRMPSSA